MTVWREEDAARTSRAWNRSRVELIEPADEHLPVAGDRTNERDARPVRGKRDRRADSKGLPEIDSRRQVQLHANGRPRRRSRRIALRSDHNPSENRRQGEGDRPRDKQRPPSATVLVNCVSRILVAVLQDVPNLDASVCNG